MVSTINLLIRRGLFQNTLKAWLINNFGVDGYGQMIIFLTVSGWIFNALIFAGFIFVSSKINYYLKENDFNFPVSNAKD